MLSSNSKNSGFRMVSCKESGFERLGAVYFFKARNKPWRAYLFKCERFLSFDKNFPSDLSFDVTDYVIMAEGELTRYGSNSWRESNGTIWRDNLAPLHEPSFDYEVYRVAKKSISLPGWPDDDAFFRSGGALCWHFDKKYPRLMDHSCIGALSRLLTNGLSETEAKDLRLKALSIAKANNDKRERGFGLGYAYCLLALERGRWGA